MKFLLKNKQKSSTEYKFLAVTVSAVRRAVTAFSMGQLEEPMDFNDTQFDPAEIPMETEDSQEEVMDIDVAHSLSFTQLLVNTMEVNCIVKIDVRTQCTVAVTTC